MESTSVYSCQECEFTTDIQHTLTRHINGTHTAKLLFCEECTYSSDRSDNLSRHIKTIHEQISEKTLASYQCDQCDNQFSYKSTLKRHKGLKHESGPKEHTAIDELLLRAVLGLNLGSEDMRTVNVAIHKFPLCFFCDSGPALCFANTLAPGTLCALKKQNFPLGQLVLC